MVSFSQKQPYSRRPAKTVWDHIQRSLDLAWPVMLSRIGLLLMSVTDTIMVGHVSAAEQAYFASSFQPQVLLLTITIGLLSGIIILGSQADGADDPKAIAIIWLHALWIAFALGIFYTPLMFMGETLLVFAQQPEDIVQGGAKAMAYYASGMIPLTLFIATTFFIEATGDTRPGMVISLAANVVNTGLNAILIFGLFGGPALGAAGANLATSLTRWLMVIALFIWVFRLWPKRHHFGVLEVLEQINHKSFYQKSLFKKLVLLGLPLAGAIALESGTFALIASFAGRMGIMSLSSYQICQNILTAAFMLAIGLATATSIRVGNAVGRGDQKGIIHVAWCGIGLIILIEIFVALLIWMLQLPLLRLFTVEESVIAMTLPIIPIMMVMIILDGIQGTMMGALRGAADVTYPPVIIAFSFTGLSTLSGYWLAFTAGYGVKGLVIGLTLGACSAAFLLCLRFAVLTSRPIVAKM